MGALPDLNARLRLINIQSHSALFRDLQSIFAFTLSTVRVDRGARKSFIKQEVVEEVGSLLVVDEDDRTGRGHGQ